MTERESQSITWLYDYGTHEIVRTRDGARWSADDVPEFRRSIEEWATNPVVDVAAVDRWVLAQYPVVEARPRVLDLMAALKQALKQNPAAGDTATGRGTGAVESPAPVPNLARLVKDATQ